MNTSDPEVIVDHLSDLSSAKEPTFFLSFLFLQSDLLFCFEVGILADVIQGPCNPRVEHFENWEVSIPLNRTR